MFVSGEEAGRVGANSNHGATQPTHPTDDAPAVTSLRAFLSGNSLHVQLPATAALAPEAALAGAASDAPGCGLAVSTMTQPLFNGAQHTGIPALDMDTTAVEAESDRTSRCDASLRTSPSPASLQPAMSPPPLLSAPEAPAQVAPPLACTMVPQRPQTYGSAHPLDPQRGRESGLSTSSAPLCGTAHPLHRVPLEEARAGPHQGLPGPQPPQQQPPQQPQYAHQPRQQQQQQHGNQVTQGHEPGGRGKQEQEQGRGQEHGHAQGQGQWGAPANSSPTSNVPPAVLREAVVCWMRDVVEAFWPGLSALHSAAVALFDGFLSLHEEARPPDCLMQLLALACLAVAAGRALEEGRIQQPVPAPEQWLSLAVHPISGAPLYEVQDLQRMQSALQQLQQPAEQGPALPPPPHP